MISRQDPPAVPIRAPLRLPVERAAALLADARAAAAVSAGIAFVVYLRTMLPGVSVGDWAEMQFVPAQLSVPHPTGYPLFVLIGKLFSLIPVGSVAFRAGLLSAAAAAGSVAVAVLIASRLGVRPVNAAAAGLALAFTGTLWLEAAFPEMNSLHLLLVGLVIHRALVWRAERRDRDLLLGALLSGLALSNHLLAATTIPIIILFVLWDARRRLRERPILLLQAGLLLLVGLTPYLFIPLRALAGPPQIYGPLTTLEGFLNLVTGADFRGNMKFFSGESLSAAWRAVPDIVAHLLERSAAPFLLASAVGLWLLARRDSWVAGLFALLAVSGLYFLANYVSDLYHYLLVGWLVLAVGVAIAGEWLIGTFERWLGPSVSGAQVLFLLLPLLIGIQQLPRSDQSANRVGEEYAQRVFAQLPPNTILLTYWDTLTTLSYKHCMEGVRPDVTLRAFDLTNRATCDVAVDPLEDEVRAGRPAFALLPFPQELDRLRASFEIIPGPTLQIPYGQRHLNHSGQLVQLELKGP
jgi:hypothetical protein